MNVYIFSTEYAGGKTPRTLFGGSIVRKSSARGRALGRPGGICHEKMVFTNIWYNNCDILLVGERPT